MNWNNINEDRDTSGLGPIEYDQSKVPQLIRKHADHVRGKSFGQQVREAQARNAELAGLIASEAESKATDADLLSKDIRNRFKDQIEGTTNSDEVIDARRPFGAETAYQTVGNRLDDIDITTSAVPINVLKLGMKNDGSDQTELMQYAIDNYERIDVPRGFYTFDELVLKENTNIQVHPDAHITLTGQMTNAAAYQDDTNLTKLRIMNGAKRGTYQLNVENANTLSVGDIIEIYDGKWLDPTSWLNWSKGEGNDWWKKQFTEIIYIEGNVVTLAEPLEFELDVTKNCSVAKVEFDNDITIHGGNWYFSHNLEAMVFKYTNRLDISLKRVASDTAKAFATVMYSQNGNISENKVKFKSNCGIRLFYFVKNFIVDSNDLDMQDEFNGDGAIQIYSYANKNRITNNTVKQKHTTGNFSDFMMGIVVHTSENNLIENNTVQGFYYGIASYFGAKHNNINSNETSYNLVAGVYLHQTWFTQITNNIIHSNGLYENTSGWVNPQNAGIVMQKSSNGLTIEGNDFHDNYDDIVILENAKNWKVLNNQSNESLGSFLRFKNPTSDRIVADYFEVSGNSYSPANNEVIKSFIRNYDSYVNHSTITNNRINGGNIGIYLYMTSKYNVIRDNKISDTLYYGIQLGTQSTFNSISGNTFVSCVKAINASGQAKLNQYHDNIFVGNLVNYDFSDAFNFADDNQSLKLTITVGFKVYSVEPNSGVEYMERVRVSGMPSNDFIKQTKLQKTT